MFFTCQAGLGRGLGILFLTNVSGDACDQMSLGDTLPRNVEKRESAESIFQSRSSVLEKSSLKRGNKPFKPEP